MLGGFQFRGANIPIVGLRWSSAFKVRAKESRRFRGFSFPGFLSRSKLLCKSGGSFRRVGLGFRMWDSGRFVSLDPLCSGLQWAGCEVLSRTWEQKDSK